MVARPGRYRATIHLNGVRFENDSEITIIPGHELAHDIRVRCRQMRFSVIGGDGAPCAGLELRIGANPLGGRLPLTNETGETSARLPVTEFKLWLLPKRFRDRRVWTDFQAKNPHITWWGVHEEVAKIPAVAKTGGVSPSRLRIVLPAATGYAPVP